MRHLPRLWLLAWCAVAAALAFVPDEKLVRYKLLALQAGTALVAATLLRPGTPRIATPLDLPVALYAAGGLLFYALSPERAVSLPELTRVLFCAAAFFAASQTVSRLRAPAAVARVWAASAALLGLYAWLQTRGGVGPLLVPRVERPFVTFGNPIFLGAYLSASAFLSAGVALGETGRRRLVAWLGAAACLAGLGATGSRGALGGFAAALLLAALRSGRGAERWAALGALAAALGAGVWASLGREWTHGMIWRDSLKLWLEHPLLGCGLGRFHLEFPAHAAADLRALWPQQAVIVNFAHNEFLQVLAETGALGVACLLAVPAALGRWMVSAETAPVEPERRRLAGAFALAAAALWAQALVSADMRFGVSAFIAFFCMGAAVSLASGREAEPLPPPWRSLAPAGAAAALALWGFAAAQPVLAQRRLAGQAAFHAAPVPESRRETARLEEALRAEPGNADLAESLGYLYAKERLWANAIERFEQAARLDAARPGPLNNLGNVYYSLGDRERAIAYWERSLTVQPAQVDARLNLGKAHYEAGRLRKAAEHLQAALALDPSNEKAQVLLRKMVE